MKTAVWWDVIRRVAREFWLPAAGAIAWTIYAVAGRDHPWDFKQVVATFGPTFFLISWATGQVFRVKKQAAIDKNLEGIEARLLTLVQRVEQDTEELVAHINGGASFCYLVFANPNGDEARFPVLAHHVGKHLLRDCAVSITDVQKFLLVRHSISEHQLNVETSFRVGTIIGPVKHLGHIKIGDGSRVRANAFFTAANGFTTQLIWMARSTEKWYRATTVTRGKSLVFRHIDPGYPDDLSIDPEWARWTPK